MKDDSDQLGNLSLELTRFGGQVDVSVLRFFLHAASGILPDVGSAAAGAGSSAIRTLAW